MCTADHAALPGVRAAGFASAMPMEAGRRTLMPISVDGRTDVDVIVETPPRHPD